MTLGAVRLLTFDLDDTLWDNRPVLLAAEQTLQAWLTAHYPRVTARYSIADLREVRRQLGEDDPALRHHMTALRKRSLHQVAESVGYGPELAEAAFAVFLEARHRITLYADVVPALERLRAAGYALASLTNGNADVHRLGLGHLFDFALSAEGVGAAKPDPRLFEAACEAAGVTAESVVHVGDEPETDIAGAHAAGVRVVWMNRLERPGPVAPAPHAEVRDMAGLLALLGLAAE